MAEPQIDDKDLYSRSKGRGKAISDLYYGADLKSVPTKRPGVGDRITDPERRVFNPNQTWNVRTSTMPGSSRNQEFNPGKPDISTEFTEAQKERLTQSDLLNKIDTRKQEPYKPISQIDRSARVEYSSEPAVASTALANKILEKEREKKKKKTTPLTRARVTGVNTGIWIGGVGSWLVFQLPFAIVSAMMLGVAGGIDALRASVGTMKNEMGIWYTLGKASVATLDGIDGLISKITGFKILDLPINLFALTYMVVLAYGTFLLILIYILYKLNRFRPLSGKASGTKYGFFLLAFVGYAIPILNIFPCFIPWTIAVWFKPK